MIACSKCLGILLTNALHHTPENGHHHPARRNHPRWCSHHCAAIPVGASPPKTCPTSSTASGAATSPARGRRAAADWDWRSPSSLCWRMGVRSRPRVNLGRGRVYNRIACMTKSWTSIHGILVEGYRVASGPSKDYPYGALDRQRPIFKARGLDLGSYFNGTLNIDIRPIKFAQW